LTHTSSTKAPPSRGSNTSSNTEVHDHTIPPRLPRLPRASAPSQVHIILPQTHVP
jgi:hypothetical protein